MAGSATSQGGNVGANRPSTVENTFFITTMQRRRRIERRGGEEAAEEEEIWINDSSAHPATEEIRSDCIARRDRQLRGTVLLQRSVRRFLNQTYDRELAARTLQRYFRRYVLRVEEPSSSRHDGENGKTNEETRNWRATDLDRRLENATIKPSIPRRRGVEPEGEEKVETMDEQDDLMWGRRRSNSWWSVSSGGSSDWSLPNEADVTHSTAPLSDSDVSQWTASTSTSNRGRREEEEEEIGGPQYEVFLWQHKQHALELARCPSSGFPFVVDSSSANISLPGMWRVRDGDVLLTINDCSTNETELSFQEVEEVLDSGVRPAILRFRRPTAVEIRARENEEEITGRGRRRSLGGGDLKRSLSMASVRGAGAGSSSSIRRDILRQRERSEASLCYVIWREEVPALGIRFQHRMGKPYPEVEAVRDDGAARNPNGGRAHRRLSPSVQPGDWLLSINDWGVRNAKFHHVLEVLHYSPRPLVLTFHRIQRTERTFEL